MLIYRRGWYRNVCYQTDRHACGDLTTRILRFSSSVSSLPLARRRCWRTFRENWKTGKVGMISCSHFTSNMIFSVTFLSRVSQMSLYSYILFARCRRFLIETVLESSPPIHYSNAHLPALEKTWRKKKHAFNDLTSTLIKRDRKLASTLEINSRRKSEAGKIHT